MEKIIFLDIDGVLCHNGYIKINGEMIGKGFHVDSNNNEYFYDKAVDALNLILSAHPESRIFLMSGWGIEYTSDDFNKILIERNLPPICIDTISGKSGWNRGKILSDWMRKRYDEDYDYSMDKPELMNTNISYVILDDAYQNQYQYKHKDNIVEVLTYKCLTYENALQAIDILNKPAKYW
jgi:hypothetical protein